MGTVIGAKMRQYYVDHPEAKAALLAQLQSPETAAKATAARRTSAAREANSIRTLRYLADHPEEKAALIARTHSPEARAKSAATSRTPISRLVQSYHRRRYYANDSETGGAEIPGKLRDMFIRTREAYKTAHAESES